MPWSEGKKVQIERAIGSIEYTSSDESDLSEGENGVQKLSGYLVKKIPWERSALAKVKRSLDDAALERLTPRARANFLPRRGHTHQSDRQRPLDSLDWAVRPPPASTYTSIQSTRLFKSGRDPIIIKIKGSRDPIAINQDSDSSSDLDDCFATYSCGFDIKWYTTSQHYTTKKEGMSNDNFARILDTERFLFE